MFSASLKHWVWAFNFNGSMYIFIVICSFNVEELTGIFPQDDIAMDG